MKNNHILILSLLFIFLPAIFFSSCKSTNILIPGQSNIILKNIHIEYEKLGDNYFSMEKYSDAITAYKKAWEDKSLYWNCYYKIAKCYVFLSDWGHALPMYEELLKKDPENSSLKASVAYIYSMTGDYEASLTLYKQIIEQQPKDEKYRENYLAIILSDKQILTENMENFNNSFESLKKDYPENTNINVFQDKYNELTAVEKEKEENKKVDK